MSPALSLRSIHQARRALDGRLHQTPLLTSTRTSERAGIEVLLKAELFQRTGSFKPRGAFVRLLQLTAAERARGVIAASSGNHAQALAYCARTLGIDCLAVMWQTASEQKISAVRAYGAQVDLEATNGIEAVKRAEQLAACTGRIQVPAYDDDAVMAGQGTLGLEILEQVASPGAILIPVSGGGLIAGMATAVKATNPDTRIIAVEPAVSPSLARALAAGHPVETSESSVADGLAAPQIGNRCLTVIEQVVDDVVSVSDDEIIAATQWLYNAAKLACEPAGAATTAALLAGRAALPAGRCAVAVVSGGNIDPNALRLILQPPAAQPKGEIDGSTT